MKNDLLENIVFSVIQSSDYKKIYSVIIDSYHTTTVVKPVAEDAFMLQVNDPFSDQCDHL